MLLVELMKRGWLYILISLMISTSSLIAFLQKQEEIWVSEVIVTTPEIIKSSTDLSKFDKIFLLIRELEGIINATHIDLKGQDVFDMFIHNYNSMTVKKKYYENEPELKNVDFDIWIVNASKYINTMASDGGIKSYFFSTSAIDATDRLGEYIEFVNTITKKQIYSEYIEYVNYAIYLAKYRLIEEEYKAKLEKKNIIRKIDNNIQMVSGLEYNSDYEKKNLLESQISLNKYILEKKKKIISSIDDLRYFNEEVEIYQRHLKELVNLSKTLDVDIDTYQITSDYFTPKNVSRPKIFMLSFLFTIVGLCIGITFSFFRVVSLKKLDNEK